MQNHGLGMDSDKICATKNTPNTTKTYSADLPKSAKRFRILLKKTPSVVLAPDDILAEPINVQW